MEALLGINIDKEPIKVKHFELRRFGSGLYKSECPECNRGLLLIERDAITFKLKEHDRCTCCGQSFIYEDIDKLNERECARQR